MSGWTLGPCLSRPRPVPELPEVETIRRQLASEVIGRSWSEITARPSRIFRTPAKEVAKELRGAVIESVERRGKVIIIGFNGGQVLLVHLGMSGQVLLVPPAQCPGSHWHLEVMLDDGRLMVFRDPRRFGFYRLARKNEMEGLKELSGVGPDPLGPVFTWERFSSDIRELTGVVKPILLNQLIFGGVGNIYSDEILYASRIMPTRGFETLSPIELKQLYHSVRTTLTASIECGGTSFDDAFTDVYGRPGLYGSRLSVYGREGEPCRRCSSILKVARIGGRTSVYCPHCQK